MLVVDHLRDSLGRANFVIKSRGPPTKNGSREAFQRPFGCFYREGLVDDLAWVAQFKKASDCLDIRNNHFGAGNRLEVFLDRIFLMDPMGNHIPNQARPSIFFQPIQQFLHRMVSGRFFIAKAVSRNIDQITIKDSIMMSFDPPPIEEAICIGSIVVQKTNIGLISHDKRLAGRRVWMEVQR